MIGSSQRPVTTAMAAVANNNTSSSYEYTRPLTSSINRRDFNQQLNRFINRPQPNSSFRSSENFSSNYANNF
jgi:GGDEF domain-containing protein